MSAFPRVRAPGMWLSLSQLGHAEMETFDDHQSRALNASDGGAWAPTSRIILGGDGLEMRATLAIGNGGGQPGVFDITDGSLGGVSSGGAWVAASGSTTNLAGTTSLTGHGHTVASGGWLNVASGGYIKVAAGGEVDNAGAFVASTGSSNTFQAGSTVAIAGVLNIGATCVATQTNGSTLDLYGDVTVKNTGTFTTAGSSSFALNGAMTVGATGAIATTSTGSITVATGGALVVNSGATATVNGTLAGSITRTAAVTRSGNTANEYLRVTTGSDANTTYDPTCDVLWYVITDDRTYKINDGTTGQMIRVSCRGVASKILTIVNSSDVVVATLDPAVCAPAAFRGLFADLIWWGGTWQITAAHGASSA